MTPRELLLKAADYIEEYGWHQGDYFGDGGCACALGAIHRVSKEETKGWVLRNEAMGILNRYGEEHGLNDANHSFAQYNDKETTTVEDVLAAMRAAADEG